jgi:hypothetical protein
LDNPRPSRISFMSGNIANREATRAIDNSFHEMGRTGQGRMLLRRDSSGPERTHYERLSGVDNNYSYFNTAGRNRECNAYYPEDIDVYEGPEYGLSLNYRRR